MQPFEEPHLRVISLLWPEYLGYYIMGILNDKGSWGEFIESNISFQCSVQNVRYVTTPPKRTYSKEVGQVILCVCFVIWSCTGPLIWTSHLDLAWQPWQKVMACSKCFSSWPFAFYPWPFSQLPAIPLRVIAHLKQSRACWFFLQ